MLATTADHAPVAGWALGIALAVLLGIAVGGSWRGRLRLERPLMTAAVRALLQLVAVAAVIAAVLEHTWASLLFAAVMFGVAVGTAAGRDQARPDWPWIGMALATAAGPVLVVVFVSGAADFTGPAIIPIAGIVIGGTMTAHTLTAWRAFAALREGRGRVEAALSLGLTRAQAVRLVIAPHAPEASSPVLDQTRTVGLVTLPGAFVGVLLGGGSAAQAAAAQLLVLIGLLAAETSAVVVSQRLIAEGRILPADARGLLPAR